MLKFVFERPFVVYVLSSQLNNWAWLDATARSDVMSESGYGWAKSTSLSIMISIDYDDRFLNPRVDHELSDSTKFFRVEG
jgi:hypothetical protein